MLLADVVLRPQDGQAETYEHTIQVFNRLRAEVVDEAGIERLKEAEAVRSRRDLDQFGTGSFAVSTVKILAFTTLTHAADSCRRMRSTSSASVGLPRRPSRKGECLLSPTARISNRPRIGPPGPLVWSWKILRRSPLLFRTAPRRIQPILAPILSTVLRGLDSMPTPSSFQKLDSLKQWA